MTQLRCDIVREGDPTVVALHGFLDSHNAPVFRTALAELVSKGRHKLVVDFGGLEYMGSSGLEAILSHLQTVRDGGGDLVCCAMNARVTKVFDLLGLTRILKIFPDAAQASASFS